MIPFFHSDFEHFFLKSDSRVWCNLICWQDFCKIFLDLLLDRKLWSDLHLFKLVYWFFLSFPLSYYLEWCNKILTTHLQVYPMKSLQTVNTKTHLHDDKVYRDQNKRESPDYVSKRIIYNFKLTIKQSYIKYTCITKSVSLRNDRYRK